ncbi:LytR family transcriptional regulator [Streptococcus iniae]
MINHYKTIGILLDVYAYNYAFKIASEWEDFPQQALYLLELMKERRELNLDFLFENQRMANLIENETDLKLYLNERIEEEQIANYILDLEIKIKNGDVIDFVRAVSPILYRLFLRLIKSQIPNIDTYIIDAKNDQYDTWDFTKMQEADIPLFKDYLSKRQSRNVTSKSLADLLQLSQLPVDIKEKVNQLRVFEKSVRNPLAHLIKAFDEEELFRTTHFSSQAFLDQIISLYLYSGVSYQRQPFYCDQVNAVIMSYIANENKA